MLLLLLLIKCSYSYFYDGISSLKSILRANLYNVYTKKQLKMCKSKTTCVLYISVFISAKQFYIW